MNNKRRQKAALFAALTAAVLIGVILFNLLFTLMAERFLWVIDTTPGDLVAISDTSEKLLKNVDPEVNDITIYFLADPDQLDNYELAGHSAGESGTWGMAYIYHLAELYARNYSFIHVGTLDLADDADYIRKNFAMTIGSSFSNLSVIIENVVEGRHSYRTYTRDNFFPTNSSGSLFFTGEDRFTSAILSLAGEDPTAYFIEGHGEKIGPAGDNDDFGEASALADLFREAGFVVKKIDLSKEDFVLSANDSLIGSSAVAILYGPTSDFICDEAAGVNEVTELYRFSATRNCNLMVFKDPGVPVLPNLEEFLTDNYGFTYADDIVVAEVNDPASHAAISADGKTFYADYEERSSSPGSGLVSSLLTLPTRPGIYFENARSITMNERWSDESESMADASGVLAYKLGEVFKAPLLSALENADGSFRTWEKTVYETYAAKYYQAKYDEVYPALREATYGPAYEAWRQENEEAFAEEGLSEEEIDERCREAAENAVEEAVNDYMDAWLTLETARQPALMTLTHGTWMYEQNETASFYCLACGSTSFAANDVLTNASYGNRDVLYSAVYLFSRNVLPYDIDVVEVDTSSLLNLGDTAANVWMVVLAGVLPAAVLGIGIGVTVRRRKHN